MERAPEEHAYQTCQQLFRQIHVQLPLPPPLNAPLAISELAKVLFTHVRSRPGDAKANVRPTTSTSGSLKAHATTEARRNDGSLLRDMFLGRNDL